MGEPRRVALVSTALQPDKKAATSSKVTNGDEEKKDVTVEVVYFDVEEPEEDFGPAYDFNALFDAKKVAQAEDKPHSEDPFDETKDEDKLNKLAKHFEEKYGPRDVRELGAGYDQNDPFVDDSELAEAMIPEGWTTQHGGHYISTGPLYIRQLQPGEEETHTYQTVASDECLAACKSMGALTLKRKVREESSAEETDSEEEQTPKETAKTKKKKKQLTVIKNDFKKIVPDLNGKKNYRTVASILAERTGDVTEGASVSSPASNDKPDDLSIKKRDKEPPTPRPRDFEGGVRKAVLAKFERDFAAEPDEPVMPLPDDVTGPLRDLIMDLTKMAATWEGGKCNFFAPEHNPDINKMLLELEYDCRQLRCGLRSGIFSHLAGHLPCTKETLIKRARKLRQEDVEMKVESCMNRLKRAIEDESGSGTGVDPVSRKLKSALKNLITEAVGLKMAVFDLHKSRFATHEEYVRNFADEELLPLWKDRPVEKESIYAEALVGLVEALRPRVQSKIGRPRTIGAASEDYDIPPPVSEKEYSRSSLSSTSVIRPSPQDARIFGPPLMDKAPPPAHKPHVKVLYTTKEAEDNRKRRSRDEFGEVVPNPSAKIISSATRPEKSRVQESSYEPDMGRPRSRDSAGPSNVDKKKFKERVRDSDRELSAGRSTPNQAQNLGRSSTPSGVITSKPSSSKAPTSSTCSKSSFTLPLKVPKQHDPAARPLRRENPYDDSRSTTRFTSNTSGGVMKKYERDSSREDRRQRSEAKILAHSTHPIVVPAEDRPRSSESGSNKSSSKHRSSGREREASSAAYSPTGAFSPTSLPSHYSAFSSLPMIAYPGDILAWNPSQFMYADSFSPMGLMQGASSAFNGVGASFGGRSASTSKTSPSSRASPYPSSESPFTRTG